MLVASLVSLAAALFTYAQAPACERMRGSSTHSDGRVTTIVVSDDARCLEVRADGRVEFTDDDADVRALEPGTTLRIVERRGGTTRRMVLAERDGRIEREYHVDDLRVSPAEGAAWMRGIVLDLVRTTGFGAEERAARIRRQHGVAGVLDEIGRLRSDHVRRVYLTALVAGGGLTDDDLRRIARSAAGQLGSDHDKSGTLLAVLDARPAGRDATAVATAVASAAETIGSDHDRGRVLKALVDRAPLTDETFRTAFFRAYSGLGSDHERRGVLLAVLARDEIDDATTRDALVAASRIGSDHDKGAVLVAAGALTSRLRTPAVRTAFDAAVRTLGSDAEYRRVMRVFER
jgi:hypothetical protein